MECDDEGKLEECLSTGEDFSGVVEVRVPANTERAKSRIGRGTRNIDKWNSTGMR